MCSSHVITDSITNGAIGAVDVLRSCGNSEHVQNYTKESTVHYQKDVAWKLSFPLALGQTSYTLLLSLSRDILWNAQRSLIKR